MTRYFLGRGMMIAVTMDGTLLIEDESHRTWKIQATGMRDNPFTIEIVSEGPLEPRVDLELVKGHIVE